MRGRKRVCRIRIVWSRWVHQLFNVRRVLSGRNFRRNPPQTRETRQQLGLRVERPGGASWKNFVRWVNDAVFYDRLDV